MPVFSVRFGPYRYDCRQEMSNRLLAADEMLNVRDNRRIVLMVISSGVEVASYVNWIIVAVTPEKKAAIVVIFK